MEIIVDAETKQNPRRRLGDPRILYIINAGARCSAPCRSIRLCLNSSRPRLARCAPFPEVSRSPAKPLAVQRPDRVRTPAFQPIRGPWRKRRNRLVAARVAVVKPLASRNLSPPDSITLAAVNATTGPADVLSGTSNLGLPQGPPVFLAVARGAARPQRKTAWLNHRAR
jgi:hypothetical protein